MINALTVLSLLLSIATVGLWVRSYRAAEVLQWTRSGTFEELFASAGGLFHSVNYKTGMPESPVRYQRKPPLGLWIAPSVTEKQRWHFAGFWWVSTGAPYPAGRSIGVPCWFVTACFTILPSTWLMRRRANRRYPDGSCLSCGYDLRATPDRCPECGSVPTKKTA